MPIFPMKHLITSLFVILCMTSCQKETPIEPSTAALPPTTEETGPILRTVMVNTNSYGWDVDIIDPATGNSVDVVVAEKGDTLTMWQWTGFDRTASYTIINVNVETVTITQTSTGNIFMMSYQYVVK